MQRLTLYTEKDQHLRLALLYDRFKTKTELKYIKVSSGILCRILHKGFIHTHVTTTTLRKNTLKVLNFQEFLSIITFLWTIQHAQKRWALFTRGTHAIKVNKSTRNFQMSEENTVYLDHFT